MKERSVLKNYLTNYCWIPIICFATRNMSPRSETQMESDKIRVITRAFAILGHLAKERRPLGVTEIASAVALPKATVYRILDTLDSERAVINRGGMYELGPVTLLLADAYRRQVGFSETARPHLLSLSNRTKETIHLFVYERAEFYNLDEIESPYQVRMHSRVGGRASLFRLSAGKALLAEFSPEDLKELHEPLPAEVAAEFPEIRSRGYAIDDEQNEHGLRCVGAAIIDAAGRPRGGVSVSAPVYRFPQTLLGEYGALVRDAAAAISREISGFEEVWDSGGRTAG